MKVNIASPKLKLILVVLSATLIVLPVVGAQQGDRLLKVEGVKQLPTKAKRYALVIGVDEYQDSQISRLSGATNDAKALADALVRYAGFPREQVILLASDQPQERQPTRGNILRRLSNLRGLVPEDGLLLLSFAGHGIERSGRGFLCTTDAQLNGDLALLEDTAISVETLRERIRQMGVKQVVIILDACRNDPSGRGEGENRLTDSFAQRFNFDVRNKEVTAFATLYATDVGHVAYEYKEKKQGYFTYLLVEGLKGRAANINGEVTLGGLVNYVEERVPKQVQIDLGAKIQRPFAVIEGYQANELVLSIGTVEPPSTLHPLPTGIDGNSTIKTGEQLFWQEIEKRNTIAAYESYLTEYPNGEFARVAKIRLASLKWIIFKPIAQNLLRYDKVFLSADDWLEVRIGDSETGRYGFIDRMGKEVIPPKYDLVYSFKEDLARVRLNGKYGFIDKTGKEVIPLKYDYAESFYEGLAEVRIGDGETGKCGFIDKTGKEVIPLKYRLVGFFKEGLAWVDLDGKRGFIDKTGKVVIPLKYDIVSPFEEGLAEVIIGSLFAGKRGFIDKTGNEVIPLKYDYVGSFEEGLAWVSIKDDKTGKSGFIDKTGKVIIPLKYDYVNSFEEGLARVLLHNKHGFIDKTGKEVIPPQYDYVGSFKEGLAEVRIGDRKTGKYGFIDKTNKMVISVKYDSVYFKDGLARVRLNGKYGFIDRTGKEVIPVKYDAVWCEAYWKDGIIGVILSGRKCFVDLYGNEYFDF